jgi:glycosyltransferase involved in cell wall biosynthesis
MAQPRFYIIATGWNCADKVKACVDSVKAQLYPNWRMILMADGCPKTQAAIDREYLHVNIYKLEGDGVNRGAAYCRHRCARFANPNQVIIFLGLDDTLEPDALATIARQYQHGMWMTYGNWKDQAGVKCTVDLRFPPEAHANNSYREYTYRSTAPNTMYAWLYDKIPTERFIKDGEWIKATTESPAMFAALEMSGPDRIGIIDRPIYNYFKGRKDNARRRFGSTYQDEVYQWVKNQEPMKRLPHADRR